MEILCMFLLYRINVVLLIEGTRLSLVNKLLFAWSLAFMTLMKYKTITDAYEEAEGVIK